jgi:hypothetical protein
MTAEPSKAGVEVEIVRFELISLKKSLREVVSPGTRVG